MKRIVIAAGLAALTSLLQVVPAHAAGTANPGRLLASNCFQCHGTDGRGGFEKLAGMSAREIYSEMKEMQAKPANGNIMNVHARGYSDQEILLIADYFSKLPR